MFLSTFFSTTGMGENTTDYFYSWPHFLYLLLNIVAFIVLWHFLKKKKITTQDKIINVALILILVLKYAGDILFIYEYYNVAPITSIYPHPFWDVDTFFSFQLCGITNIILPITIWFNIKGLKEFVYASSILGGIAVILFPVTVLYGSPYVITFPVIRSSFIHFFLLFIPLFLINRGDHHLSGKRWTQLLIGAIIIVAWAMFGNLVIDIGDNNLYLMENPFYGGPIPILNALPNGWHNIISVILVILGFILIYYSSRLFEENGLKNFVNKFKKQKKT